MNRNKEPTKQSKKHMGIKLLSFFLIIGTVGAVCFNGIRKSAQESGVPPFFGAEAIDAGAQEEEWRLTLVNKWNPLPSPDRSVKTVKLSNGERVDQRIYPYLQKMFDAARSAGIYPTVSSGYRTEKEQKQIYHEKISAYKAEGLSEAEARNAAELWVAVPGTSEHQLGLSVDINADGVHSTGEDVYEWLAQNAHRYGFICRYPAHKTNITGVANEPWHYRYVGIEAAGEIHSRGICLEEYLGKIN